VSCDHGKAIKNISGGFSCEFGVEKYMEEFMKNKFMLSLACALGILNTVYSTVNYDDQQFVNAFPNDRYKIVMVPHQGLFYLDDEDDCVKNILKSGKPWEPEADGVIHRYARPGTTVLDIGAHIGTHTIALSHAVGKDGKVYAFEPQKKIYRELVMNMRLNQLDNVQVLRNAVGATSKKVFLGAPIAQNEGARFVAPTGEEEVEMRTVDSLALVGISFMKIDVENYELEVLKGAVETIQREKPVILIEIQGNHVQASQVSHDKIGHMAKIRQEVVCFLESLGYTVSHFNCDDYLAIPR
jgi:FkbM family methyltransferase